jgi:hypothetical protein
MGRPNSTSNYRNAIVVINDEPIDCRMEVVLVTPEAFRKRLGQVLVPVVPAAKPARHVYWVSNWI